MKDLQGKVAVVTGAASGIGLALAKGFAAQGMAVALADIEPDALAIAGKELAADIGEDKVLTHVTDVRDPAAIESLRDATFERFGTAHVVCNNAGVASGGFTWTIEPERFKWVIEVDLLSVAYGIHAFVPRMIEQGEGHVVNTASAAGLLTGPGMAPYFTAKHGVVALSEALHYDLQLAGSPTVGVTVLCPEWVRTRIGESERNLPSDLQASAESDDPAMAFFRDTVMGLVAGGSDPAEIAEQVVDAVREGRFYVIPHAVSTLPRARDRWTTIESGGTPTLQAP